MKFPRPVLIFGLSALLLLALVLVVQRQPDQPSGLSSPAYSAFASKAVTGNSELASVIGGDVLIGGLKPSSLLLANHTQLPVSEASGLSSFTITLPQQALFTATGKSVGGDQYKGTFTVAFQGQHPFATGVWSVAAMKPNTVGYEFLDDSVGLDYSGALILGTTHGNLYLPDGTTIVASSQRTGPVNSLSSPVTLTLSFPNGNTLACIGTPIKNTAMQGISGVFVDPVSHHSRVCNVLMFS